MNKPFMITHYLTEVDSIVDMDLVEHINANRRTDEYGEDVVDVIFDMNTGREYREVLTDEQYTGLLEFMGMEVSD